MKKDLDKQFEILRAYQPAKDTIPEQDYDKMDELAKLIGLSVAASYAGGVPVADAASTTLYGLYAAWEMGRRSAQGGIT